MAFTNPPSALLLKERTEDNMPFNVIGVHFPGVVSYCKKHKEEVRAYVVVYLRSVLGIAYKSADLQVYEEPEKLPCQKRMNFEGPFRQQSDVCSRGQVAENSTKR